MKLEELQGEHSCLVASVSLCAFVCVWICVCALFLFTRFAQFLFWQGSDRFLFPPRFLTGSWENKMSPFLLSGTSLFVDVWTHIFKERRWVKVRVGQTFGSAKGTCGIATTSRHRSLQQILPGQLWCTTCFKCRCMCLIKGGNGGGIQN